MVSNKKRVCIITGGHWAAVMGGAQYQAKCLVDEMVKKDEFEICYLSRVIDPVYQAEGYKLMQIAKPDGVRRYGFFLDARKLICLLKDIKPDVIYQRGLQSYTGFAAYYATKHDCKFIFHIASDRNVSAIKSIGLPWHWHPKLIEKKIGEYGLKHADYVIAQTRQQANFLEKNYARSVAAVVANFHPFPKEVLNKDEPPLKVVWIANFKPAKRPEIFLKLAEDLEGEEGVEFVMVGRPGDPKLYEELHTQIAMRKNMRYLGECSLEKVNIILAGAHVFVNTSIVEGFPNTFIQAWMRKVPVISLHCDPDGILEHNKVGFFSGTYEKMLQRVVELIENPALRDEMGERAQRYAFEKHSEKNIAKLIGILKK